MITEVTELSKINLKKGWNFISISDDNISPNIFYNQKNIWKYQDDGNWQFCGNGISLFKLPQLNIVEVEKGFIIYSENAEIIDIFERINKLTTFNTDKEMNSCLEDIVKKITIVEGIF